MSKKDLNKIREYSPSSSRKNVNDVIKEEKKNKNDEFDINFDSVLNLPKLKKSELIKYKYLKRKKFHFGKHGINMEEKMVMIRVKEILLKLKIYLK